MFTTAAERWSRQLPFTYATRAIRRSRPSEVGAGGRRRGHRGGAVLGGVDAEELQLAVQRAPLHADEVRSAADVAAEAEQLRFQVLPLEQLARVAELQGHDLAGAVELEHGRRRGPHLGR